MEIPEFIVHYSRGARFSDPEYLVRRRKVERKLRNSFLEKGGRPVLDHPIYFFLGRNLQFETVKQNQAYSILLNDLPSDIVSFTYGDSVFSCDDGYRQQKGGSYMSELCTHIFRIEDLPALFAHADFLSPGGLHVEAQLWRQPADAIARRMNGTENV